MKYNLVKLSTVNAAVSTATFSKAVAFLVSRRPNLQQFDSLEDLALAVDEDPALEIAGFEHNFLRVRNALAKELWKNQVFIGISVIEQMLFDALRYTDDPDPSGLIFSRIKDYGLHRPGFVLYPLHSFGILGMGFVTFLTKERLSFTDRKAGIAILPQCNSHAVFMSSLAGSVKALRIGRTLPKDSLEDYLRRGVLSWLRLNPIMLVRVRAYSGSYYETQFLLLGRLQFATSYVMMLTCFQEQSGDQETARLLSSSNVNNFETLDLKHYILFQASLRHPTKLQARRIPMNLAPAQLAEMSELNIQLDPAQPIYRRKLMEAIRKALADAEAGYLENCLDRTSKTVKARVFRKLFTSLTYFRKSFHETSLKEENVVSLAVAFETLLTDGYSPGVTERILRRVKLALTGIPGNRKMRTSVAVLFECRGASVHSGVSDKRPDWKVCHQAFVYCFLTIVRNCSRLPRVSDAPIRDILKDD